MKLKARHHAQAKIKHLPRRNTVARAKPDLQFDEPAGVSAIMDLQPSQLRELTLLLGDEDVAQRVIDLAQKFPLASLPELVVYDWLSREEYQFTFQGEFGGGRKQKGGAVPDFVVNWGGKGLVLRVQGEYWHTLPGQVEKDYAQRLQMMGQYVNGLQVTSIVDVWEEPIYRRLDYVMRMAMAGIEIGH